jgi:hypothetical protein
MKKTITIGIVLICAAIYYCSNNPDIIERYTDFREKKPFIGSDKTGFGWLYGMCYLSQYRISFNYSVNPAKNTLDKNINLYLFSDSYLYYPTRQEHFYGTDTLIKIKWWEPETYRSISSLNKKRKNILVIEMTERYVRDICTDYHGIINMLIIDSLHQQIRQKDILKQPVSLSSFMEKHLFNPRINTNLELNLFDYKIFRPFKELKADFNFYFFNRVNNDVFVDTANKFLYYMPTVTGNQNMNSFYPIGSVEISSICSNLNKVYDYYKSNGFEEVYLAIIPNPVTIINPTLGNHNNLINRLCSIDSLRIKVFDIRNVFLKYPQKYYSRSDSHWNSEGLQTWLDEFNKILENKSAGK